MSNLTISGLSKSFGSHMALRDISVDMASGEFICLLGESGCGKTTLLRIIAGLETHDAGDLHLDGSDLGIVPSHKRNVGMVFQSLALFPHLNVGGNVAYGMRLAGVPKDEAALQVTTLLDMVGLSGLENRSVATLSGGQRQRVAIARALALKPDIFLMDEPFSALDAGLRDQMQKEVKNIQRELDVTTVFVTHDQREAMALADRIIVINSGVIEQAAAPDDLYTRPASRYVAEFIGLNNIFEEVGKPDIAVRPEAITLSTVGSGLNGTIVRQRRLGALIEREIIVGNQIVHQSEFADQGSTFREGDSVSLSWPTESEWTLPT